MNGWQRIGVVLSAIIGLPVFAIAYIENDSAYGTIYPTDAVRSLKGQEFWNELYRQAEREQPDRFKGCVGSSIEMKPPFGEYDRTYSVSCDKDVFTTASAAIPFAAIPIALIWGFGWAVAWIRAGFKRPKS